jgi:hypothetical protein
MSAGFALSALSIFPFLLLWSIFFLVYKIAVNADVSIKAAAFSSLIVADRLGDSQKQLCPIRLL